MSSFCKLYSSWKSLLLRVTSSQLSHVLKPKRLLKTAASYNLKNHLECSCTDISFKAAQRQLLIPHFAVKKTHKFLHMTPTLLSFASDGDFLPNQRKKFGALKRRAKREDWYKGEELIATVILEKGEEVWTYKNWIELSERLSEVMTGSWEILCIIYLYNTSNLTLGKSLMEYITSQPEEPSSIFLTYCIGLLGHTSCGDTAQEELMKKYYDNLMSASEIVNSLTMEILSKGLCYTKYYKECEKLMTNAKETNSLSTGILVNTLIGGVRNHDHHLCNDVLRHFDDAASSATFLQQFPLVVEEALKSGNKDGLRMFFSFLNKMDLIPPKHIIGSVMESLERYEPGHWRGTFGYVHHITGRCSVCKQSMEEKTVSDEDFKAVQSAFLDQVIVSENIFYKSTPDEVQSFITFVAENGPFDVVIDGLNVLYTSNTAKRQNKPDPYMLSVLDSSFTEHGLKVLILGNKSLQKNFPRAINNSSFFGTYTTKADDAFFLYAALHSGKNTFIVSADKLRDHKFRLEPKLRPIFHQWLKLAQVYDFYLHQDTDTLILKRQKFNLGPVEDSAGWHLPFDDTNMAQPFGRNGVLCLRQGAENFIIDKRHNKIGLSRGKFPNSRLQPKRPRGDSIPWFEH